MSRTSRLLGLGAAALRLPAAAASAATFTGTTTGGSPISFDAVGDQVSNVRTMVPMACMSKAGIEPFEPSGTFTANGTESKLSELRPSAVLNRDVTQNFSFTGTIAETTATGKLALNYLTTDFDIFTMTTKVTTCVGSTDFTATAPKPVVEQPAQQPEKKEKKKKKKRKGGRA